MELSEIIKTGTVDSEGIMKIEELKNEIAHLRNEVMDLWDKNDKLKKAFGYSIHGIFSKKEIKDELKVKVEHLHNVIDKNENKLHEATKLNRICKSKLHKIHKVISGKRKVKTKDILKIINDEQT